MNVTFAATQLTRWWDRFWFSPIPVDSYALLRIVFGLLGLIEVLSLTPVGMFWALDGLARLPGGGFGIRSQLLEWGAGDIAGWTLFLTLVAAFACMTVGYRTSLAIAVAFGASLVQQMYWNPLPLSSADSVLLVVLFYLLWADCRGRVSIDAGRRVKDASSDRRTDVWAIWPLQLIRIHIAVIYFTTGVWKLSNGVWRDGTAVSSVLNLNMFARFPYEYFAGFEDLLVLGTYATLLWELTFPLMLLTRWTRSFAVAVGILLHLGMWATLEIGLFSWIMLAAYVAYVDPHYVASLVDRWKGTLPDAAPSDTTYRIRDLA